MREVYEGSLEELSIKDSTRDDNATVTAVTFYSVNGMQSAKPVKGVNILRETLSNGTVRTRKVLVK